MEIKYNIEKSQRKVLAQKIAELTGAEVRYAGVPTCAYEIDFFTLSKDSVLSFNDRSDTEIVERVLEGLAEAGYTGETITYPEGTTEEDIAELEREGEAEDTAEVAESDDKDIVEIAVTIESDTDELAEEPVTEDAAETESLNVNFSFPLKQHTVQTLTNLICMIHSRGALISKATGGTFFADKSLVDEIGKHEFRSVYELIAFIREWGETNPPLTGISFDSDKLTFDGFGEADTDHVQTFMKLAAAMNQMAITQKRVQAKDVDDSNEKYTLRVWLIRLGMNGTEYKEDRKRLMENLSGHSAFRNDTERVRWTERQQAKREAKKAERKEEAEDEIPE